MAATVKIDGMTSTIDRYHWEGDEPVTSLLNSYLDPKGPWGYDPNPDYTAAAEAVKRFGGKILSFDEMDFDPDVVY